MVTEPTQNDGDALYFVLTAGADFSGVLVGSPVSTSDHSAVLTDVVLERPILHLTFR